MMHVSKDALLSHPLSWLVKTSMRSSTLRRTLIEALEKKLYTLLIEENPTDRPRGVQEEKFYVLRNMFNSLDKAFQNDHISQPVIRGLLRIFVGTILWDEINGRRKLLKEHCDHPRPGFLTISPTKACNLACAGCYANSSSSASGELDHQILHRIIAEKTDLWGAHFTVISGGEPFLWRSQGKDILDIAQEHSDNYFLIYTNGTLIDRRAAERIAETGNVTLAISVEGLAQETDGRRGKGVHRKILRAFRHLRDAGVPFGISVTATRHNAEAILGDDFIDFYFDEQKVIYAWIFHYMPIGRRYDLDLMVTPEQRVEMWEREQELIRQRGIFLADFWNSGAVSNGCISAGRMGGYFYIDWNGNVAPCVFFPFFTHNIIDVYRQGGNLDTVLLSPYFKAIRRWQNGYSYMKPAHCVGNQIVPCPIRDHYRLAHGVIRHFHACPMDGETGKTLDDQGYRDGLVAYGDRVSCITDEIWKREYLRLGEKAVQTEEKMKLVAS